VSAVLASRLPAETLLGRLKAIRSRMLHRVSDEALSDVKAINAVLNAIEYRGPTP
jgi:hypothetical protein